VVTIRRCPFLTETDVAELRAPADAVEAIAAESERLAEE
jgi:hypothetical protein